jgi:hypothetical protein
MVCVFLQNVRDRGILKTVRKGATGGYFWLDNVLQAKEHIRVMPRFTQWNERVMMRYAMERRTQEREC